MVKDYFCTLIKHGADIENSSKIIGHASSIFNANLLPMLQKEHLQKIHRKFHPRALKHTSEKQMVIFNGRKKMMENMSLQHNNLQLQTTR